MKAGVVYIVLASMLFASMPAYLQWLPDNVHSIAVIGQRVIWTSVILLLTFILRGTLGQTLKPALKLANWPGLLAGTMLISVPWGLFVWGPLNGETIAVALGFFLGPMLIVLIGLLIFKEKMSPLQWLATGLTMIAVCSSILQTGQFSWIATSIALCFASYIVLRKFQPVPVLSAFFIENLTLLPVGIWACIHFDDVSHPFVYDMTLLLKFSGIAVLGTLGMNCWLRASERLPLYLLGLIGYLEPLLIFLVAILVMAEAPAPGEGLTYTLIGIAFLVLIADGLYHLKVNAGQLRTE